MKCNYFSYWFLLLLPVDLLEEENHFKVNINVISLGLGKLADMSQGQDTHTHPHTQVKFHNFPINLLYFCFADAGLETFQRPVICDKCSAALSCLSSVWKKVNISCQCNQVLVLFLQLKTISPVRTQNGILSCCSVLQLWVCEFCGHENSVDESLAQVCIGQRAGVRTDDLYLPSMSEDDYQNLEDTMVVFCVDISGSMTVTTKVCVKQKT